MIPSPAVWTAKAASATLVLLLVASCSPVAPDEGLAPVCISAGDLPDDQTAALEEAGIWSPIWNDPPGADALRFLGAAPPGVDPETLIWKQALYVDEGATGSVSIVSPSDVRLLVTTMEEWSAGLDETIVERRLAQSVAVRSCENEAGSYPGVILMGEPSCVILLVKVDDRPERRVELPFFGGTCSEDFS